MTRVTSAERRALAAVWEHGTAKQAAAALGKSARTVEQQLRSAREKLDVTTTIEAIRVSGTYVDNADRNAEPA
jgi:DNA-binding CsgD family transcriptional regulator